MASAPVFDGKRLYVSTFDGRMMCIDPELQKIIWEVAPEDGSPFYASPALAKERVIFAGRDGVVRCLETGDGKELWNFRARDKVDSSPVIAGDRVFFGSDDGKLYAVGLADGRLRWHFTAGAAVVAGPAVGESRLVVGVTDGMIYCFGDPEAAP